MSVEILCPTIRVVKLRGLRRNDTLDLHMINDFWTIHELGKNCHCTFYSKFLNIIPL